MRWCGEPGEAEGEQHVEWSVDEDVTWGGNTVPAGTAVPGVGEDGERVLLRGRLGLGGDGTAVLEVAGALVLLDLGDPAPPAVADGTWVEVRAAREGVGVWPYRL
ncbi:hypothetical protein [Kitasatospora sp. NPDC089509]|uniref:hypothetical protein n=1 Tax=Kitasatospora sp. NPDC089509 TaxID=3364079 RepID=UPI0037F5144F